MRQKCYVQDALSYKRDDTVHMDTMKLEIYFNISLSLYPRNSLLFGEYTAKKIRSFEFDSSVVKKNTLRSIFIY